MAISDGGQSPYSVDESFFTMITASNSVYDTAAAQAIQQSLPTITLDPGQNTSGQIAFQVPNSETPAVLEYKIPHSIDEFVTGLPTPGGAVSEPNFEVNANVQGTAKQSSLQDLTASASIMNTTSYFYTGQTIAIIVGLTNFNTGTTATVNSIASATTGISILQISAPLPVKISGSVSGNEYDIIVYMLAPPTSFSGTISLSVSETG